MLTYANLRAQDAMPKLKEAETAYAAKNLSDSRYSLQEALNEINMAIGKDIMAVLPTKIKDLAFNASEDNISGAAGFAGLFVTRSFGTGDKNAKIEIISDSPLIAGVNTFLAMPAMMTGSDPNQKRIKIAGYKSMLNKSVDDNNVESYTIQVPINQTLLTLTLNGVATENEAVNIANSLPIDKIAKYSAQ
jgi:hypothetical protein